LTNRYAIQFSQPQSFFPLTLWVVGKIEATLWQPTENEESNGVQAGNGSTHGTEGFSTQSKWLYLFSAVLIEVDEKDIDSGDMRDQWYYSGLVTAGSPKDSITSVSASRIGEDLGNGD
jgi:hypothetical protein